MNSAVPEANAFMERLRSRFFEERERFFSGSCGVRGPRSGGGGVHSPRAHVPWPRAREGAWHGPVLTKEVVVHTWSVLTYSQVRRRWC